MFSVTDLSSENVWIWADLGSTSLLEDLSSRPTSTVSTGQCFPLLLRVAYRGACLRVSRLRESYSSNPTQTTATSLECSCRYHLCSFLNMAELVDPTQKGNYPVILGDSLLGKNSNEIFTGVRCKMLPKNILTCKLPRADSLPCKITINRPLRQPRRTRPD